MTTLSASVVIPAYRAAGTIERGLDSLLAQSVHPPGYEIIVVDDASPDDTARVIESYIPRAAEKGITLNLLRQDRNAGPAAARNRGAFAATGDIVIFTDADCEPTETWLAEMLAPFDDPAVSAVKGAYLSRQPDLGARFAQAEFEDRYRMLEAAHSVDVVFSYSAAFRRQVFLDLDGFDMRFPVADNEDTDLSWRLVEAGHKAVFNPRALLYHLHPPSLWTYYKKKVSRGYWRVIVYRRFPGKAIKDSYTPQSLKLQILLAFLAIGFVPLALIWGWAGWALLAALLAFAATTVTFTGHVLKTDPGLALMLPFLLFGRAVAIGTGILLAIPRAIRANPLERGAA